MNKERYANIEIREVIESLRMSTVIKCKICGGEGYKPTGGMIDDISYEYDDCICKKTFLKKNKMIIAGIPKRRLDVLKQSFKKKMVLNTLSNEKVSLYKNVVPVYVKKFKSARKQGLGLMFFGVSGSGKTTSGILIAAKLLTKDYDCHYITFRQIMNVLYDSYEDKGKSRLFKEIIDVDFLVVDELSLVGRVTPHMVAEFTSICKARFENEKPTILISNYNTIDEILLNFGEPMASLLNEAFIPFKFYGKDFREDKFEHLRKFF